ncbi:HEXXH motif-containing putative peptide modification protein [Micromonospora sp. NPDC000207]|uniref:aKG-HExxH-type peptide beta-hydroxylase n=1 Tax=Micromonospora sp. NPDC000207 TaxID=3154246 RepID=UPI003321B963
MPAGTFLAIARGGGGHRALRHLRAGQLSRNLLAVREVVSLGRDSGHRDAALAERGWHLLADLRRHHPEAARSVLTHPSVGVWAVRTLAELRDGDPQARPAMLGAVVAATALRAGTQARVTFPTSPDGRVATALPGVGLLRRSAGDRQARPQLWVDGARGRVALDGVEVAGGDRRPSDTAPTWHPVFRLRAGNAALFHLDDPMSLVSPDTVVPLDAAGATDWRSRLAPGWRLLATRHRWRAVELAEMVSVVAPLRPDEAGRAAAPADGVPGTTASASALTSGTLPTAVGCIALAGRGDARTVAATLVHEVAHNKLAALDDLFPLVARTGQSWHPAPWRDGVRPLSALLQGLYAHVAVGEFWRRQRHQETAAGRRVAAAESARIRVACREVADLLGTTDGLTRYGRVLVDQLDRVLREWEGRGLPPAPSVSP